jgi:stage II sporulation protein D
VRPTSPTRHSVLTLLLGVALAAPVAVAGAGPTGAAGCAPSGGATLPTATAAGDVVLRGGGWGHGLGMSQYGAQGAARLGCSASEILARYYAGTSVAPAAMPSLIRLRMLDNGYRVDVEAVQGTLVWSLPGCAPAATATPTPSGTPTPTPTPTPPSTPSPSTTGPPCPPAQPQGARWQLHLDDATHSTFVLDDLGVLPRHQIWSGGSAATPLDLVESGAVAHLTTWRGASIYLERWVRWDRTRFTVDGALLDAVQRIGTTATGPAMDKYLWGVAEVPSSFPPAALQAQAIAARTYATKRAGRILMPTPADQNWTGWAKENEGTNAESGLRWRAAVDATSGQVVVDTASGGLVDALYSSSMGGHTEDERYVWGVDSSTLRAVDDSAWDAASSNPADKRSWAVGLSWAALASRLGFTSISTVSVPPRGDAARTAGVRVVGIRGGRLVTAYVDGWDVRQALGLLSPGFTITMRRAGGAGAQPIVGDWNGDGRDDLGWFRNGQVALRMTSHGTTWVKRFRYGRAGDIAVVGDWDRNGTDDIGVFRSGQWLLRTGLTAGPPTTIVRFGRAGDRPVVGSWTGKRLGLGVVRGSTWLLRRSLTSGRAQHTFRFGRPGDVPVVGSWTGGRRTGIGVERDGRWLLRNRRSAGPAGTTLTFGTATGRAVVGDWAGDHRTGPGSVMARSFTLRAGPGKSAADATTSLVTFLG